MPPFTADTVTVSPFEPPVADIVGVVSEVTLSVLDEPESEAAARSGAAGADGAVVSMVTVEPVAAEPGPVTPPDEVTDPLASVGMTVPWPQPDTVTVNVAEVPTVGDVENVHPAVPVFERSVAAVSVVASTFPLKVSV